jgi:hypothetical protein
VAVAEGIADIAAEEAAGTVADRAVVEVVEADRMAVVDRLVVARRTAGNPR